MTIADAKHPTETHAKKKHAAELNEPSTSKSSTKPVTVVRRPVAVQTSAETTTRKPDVSTKPNKPTYEKRMRALSPVVRLRKKLEANMKRLSKVSGDVQRWANAPSELRDAATTATTALTAMIGVATALPDNFKPERERKTSARQLCPGTKVVLHEKFRARYECIFEPGEQRDLEVVSVARRGLVSVRTSGGARLVLPRAHVMKSTTDEQGTGVGRGSVVDSLSSAPTTP